MPPERAWMTLLVESALLGLCACTWENFIIIHCLALILKQHDFLLCKCHVRLPCKTTPCFQNPLFLFTSAGNHFQNSVFTIIIIFFRFSIVLFWKVLPVCSLPNRAKQLAQTLIKQRWLTLSRGRFQPFFFPYCPLLTLWFQDYLQTLFMDF